MHRTTVLLLDYWFETKGQSAYVMPSIRIGHDRPYDWSLEPAWKIVWR
jgi:hypothetical protein